MLRFKCGQASLFCQKFRIQYRRLCITPAQGININSLARAVEIAPCFGAPEKNLRDDRIGLITTSPGNGAVANDRAKVGYLFACSCLEGEDKQILIAVGSTTSWHSK